MATPNDRRVFLEGDLGENGGQVAFETVKDFVDWATREGEFWAFLVERHQSLPRNTLARTIADHISQITVHGEKLVNTGTDDPDAVRRLNESFEAYRAKKTLHSSNAAAARVKLIYEKLGLEAALGALETIKSSDFQPENRGAMSGAVAYVHLSQFGEPTMGSPEIAALQASIAEIREQTSSLVQGLRDDQRAVQAAHDAMVADGRRLGHHALQVWRRFRRRMNQRAGQALASLEATDQAYSEQMQLQAPVDYWTDKKADHTRKASTLRWVLLGYTAVSIGVIGFFARDLPELAPQYKGETLVFAGAAAAALLTIAFWGGRILVRLYLSELHLAGDAWERATMAKTYLALTKEGNAGEADRPIVLGALFRQGTDGVVKEDNVPDTSLIAMLARVLDKR
ncbi:MAG: DUF6161 domain-containing protein [Thalassobaculum sp.]|uniref:DUF6161 domain-containing protein n=1 Tax=Thalassobaculum sp. TaxID=2022740 RepID=UPI0032EC04C2